MTEIRNVEHDDVTHGRMDEATEKDAAAAVLAAYDQ